MHVFDDDGHGGDLGWLDDPPDHWTALATFDDDLHDRAQLRGVLRVLGRSFPRDTFGAFRLHGGGAALCADPHEPELEAEAVEILHEAARKGLLDPVDYYDVVDEAVAELWTAMELPGRVELCRRHLVPVHEARNPTPPDHLREALEREVSG